MTKSMFLTCPPSQRLIHDPDEIKYYSIIWRPPFWQPGTVYFTPDDQVVPGIPNGYLYVCIDSGKSGTVEPQFATIEEAETADNTARWKAQTDNAFLRAGDAITASTWLADPSGATLDNDTFTGFATFIRVAAVPIGTSELTLTNRIDVLRSNGRVERFDRSLVLTVQEL